MEDGATAEHQNIHMAKIFLKPVAQAADVLILGEVRGASVAARAQRVNLLGNIFQEFATPCH